MPASSGGTDGPTVIDRFDGGVGWIARPDEPMRRAGHALVADGDVWVTDPVDAAGLDDLLAGLGTVRGVVVLLDRHRRDSATVATRHDVSVWVPASIGGVASELDAPTERFEGALADSGFVAHAVVDSPFWQETALVDRNRGVVVVPEAVGTADYVLTGDERLGVHPMLRLTPPSVLGRFDPDRVLVGHGAGVHENASAALDVALQGSRARAPTLLAENLRSLLPI